MIGRNIVFSGLVYKLLERINCVSREIAYTLEMAGQKQANKYVLLYAIIIYHYAIIQYAYIVMSFCFCYFTLPVTDSFTHLLQHPSNV
jgi:hypothetical protein